MSPDELRAHCVPQLSKFLSHARRTTPFYGSRLDFDISSADEISKHWSNIPILTRAEAVANQDRLLSVNVPPEAGPSSGKETSGSTGMPLRYRASMSSDVASTALTERMFRWWRVDGSKTLAHISQAGSRSPQGERRSGWHTARPNGVHYSLFHMFDIEQQLQWLAARRPAYLASFAGIIKELAATARRGGVELKFDLVFSAAAMLDSETRDLVRSVFGAEIADTYGSQEAGHLAAECPDCGEYHVSADAAVIEILRDDGSPAAPGEVGRVIVTPFHNYAMPLVRYELGDCAEVGTDAAVCPRRLPRLRRILGRYRNLFRFRDGTTQWPVSTAFFLHDYLSLKQFQIIQTDFDHIEIRYVPDGEPRQPDIAALTERVRNVLKQPVDVSVIPVEKIERAATGKYEDCVSLVAAD